MLCTKYLLREGSKWVYTCNIALMETNSVTYIVDPYNHHSANTYLSTYLSFTECRNTTVDWLLILQTKSTSLLTIQILQVFQKYFKNKTAPPNVIYGVHKVSIVTPRARSEANHERRVEQSFARWWWGVSSVSHASSLFLPPHNNTNKKMANNLP